MKKYFLSAAVIISFVAYSVRTKLHALTLATPTDTPSNSPGNLFETNPTPIDTPTSAPTPSNIPVSTPAETPKPTSAGLYKDGTYTGDVADAFYGNVQVQAVISGGRLSQVKFLDYPQDRRTSEFINSQATPMLSSEAITAQSANVDTISGATQTSRAFRESLQSALDKARN
jgi:uncharacterized protein with FMN-binding domain